MNKLFTKIAALALGATMAVGVGVAVASNSEAVPVHASAAWVAHTGAITAGNEYLIVAVSGSYSMNPANSTASGTTTKAAGEYSATSFTAASGPDRGFIFADAGSSKFYIKDGACFVRANGTTNNGLASATSNDTNPNYGIWTVTETGTSGQYTIINDNSRQISLYGTTNWRSYGTTSGSKTNVKLYEKSATPQTITVDPSSKEAYTDETFSLTTNATSASWALSNNTCGATLSAASGKTVTVSAASAGSVRVTATASGYTSPYVDLTFSERPTSPYITPEKSSTSGYTGQNETISFTYGNLSGSLGVSSSNTSVVTVGTPSYSAGEGSVQFNFVGAGSTTVKFKDGSTELASVSVSVTASSVTITGLPASRDVYIGKTVDLGSLISVTATGIYSNAVTWESDDDGIATVTAAGVVSGVSEGDVDITVTSDDYPSATMTCTVSVSEAPLEYEIVFGTAEGTSGITDFSNTSYVIPSGVTLGNIQGNIYSNTSNQAASLRFGKSGTTGSFDATISGNYYITSVKCNLKYYGSDSTATFAVTPSGGSAISKSLTSSWADYTYDVSAAKTKTVTLGTDVNGKRAYLSGFTITYAAQKVLSNIALSGTYPTTFTKGDTFSHAGMVVTANYSDSTSATVTSSATWSSPDMSTTGAKTITVSYSDEYGSASQTYSITVSYAAPTSVTLSSNSATVALEETFDLSEIDVTINPSATADQTAYAWSLYDDGDLVEDVDYVWLSPEIMSYAAGTFVFRCTSTEDGTKYAEFTLEVSGDPIAHLKDEGDHDVTDGSMTVFADAGIISFEVTTENFQGTLTYTWSSSNTSIIAIDADADDMCDYEVKAAGSARLSCRIQGSVKGDVTVYVDVTVSAVTVTSVTWTAPTIDVFSGATLTSSDVSSWNVKYSTNSGKTDQSAPVGSTTVKIGGSAVSLPHTWVAADNGKTLGVEYGGVSSSTTTVTVTQTINAVYAPNVDTHTVSWTASAAADLGAQISSQGETDEGTISTGDYEWAYTRTLTSLTSGKSDNISFQGSTWIQLGSNNSMESVEFTTSAIPGTIKSVSVVTATAGSHELTIDVGGTKYLEDEALHLYSGTAAAANPDPDDCIKTGTGSSSGAITITIAPTASTKKAMVIRSISVTYETEGSGTTNIANDASHKAAQRVAVAFANAFNDAMDETENCTTGLDAAWSTCSSAYTSFKSAAAALGETEEAWAKNLIKYATVQWSDDSGEACIERMMKTYEVCVQKHGKTDFMSDLVTLGRVSNTNPISLIGNNVDTNTVAIIVIVSVISVSAIGGYFFLRKRKENN